LRQQHTDEPVSEAADDSSRDDSTDVVHALAMPHTAGHLPILADSDHRRPVRHDE
jgi:hypothetical protein